MSELIHWIPFAVLGVVLALGYLYMVTRPLETPEEERDAMVRRIGRYWR